ncbi:MFS transporter, partial [Flavihumibacter sp. CACIAM 22H1]|uniref:MFS transporter n=1 Tax=Flavihumibacter sp. CACIAM 22H1 TaxID=1812911 RepID=UPI0025C70495
RWSPRHMVVTGGLLSVAANVLISFSSSYYLILILWALNGYFQSMAWAPGGKILVNWWPRQKHGLVFGWYTMAAASSSVLTYFLSISLVHDNDWRSLFRWPVLFLFLALIIYAIFSINHPRDKGFDEPAEIGEKQAALVTSWKARYRIVFSNRSFMLACLSIGFQSMARYGLLFWLPIYVLGDSYKTQPELVWMSLLLPIGMAIGAFSFGFISDRFFHGNRIWTISLGMFCSSLVCLLIFCIPEGQSWWIACLFLLAGFFVYGPQSNFWPLCPELLGNENAGTGIGIMNASAYFFAAAGEPVIGRFLDYAGSPAVLFLLIAGISFISSVSILLVRNKPAYTT